MLFIFVFLNLFYSYSLTFGYFADDYMLVPLTFADIPKISLSFHFRPLWYLSYSISTILSDSAIFQRAINLLLFNLCVWFCFRIMCDSALAPLIVLSTFLHPAMVFSVTWISQRNDLILLIFVLLLFLNRDKKRSYLYMLLSDFSKSPFVFQNLFVVYRDLRTDRKYFAAFSAILIMIVILIIGFLTTYQESLASNLGLSRLEYHSIGSMMVTFVARCIKILEGIIYVLVPFSAFYRTHLFGGAIIFYIVIWSLFIGNFIMHKPFSKNIRSLLIFGILMAVPLSVGSGLRVILPLVPFIYIPILWGIDDVKLTKKLLIPLIIINLIGSSYSYNFSNRGCYSLEDTNCTRDDSYENYVPAVMWDHEREQIVNNLVDYIRENVLDSKTD
jgi:hypothetical protein